jgi:hypothetical protein
LGQGKKAKENLQVFATGIDVEVPTAQHDQIKQFDGERAVAENGEDAQHDSVDAVLAGNLEVRKNGTQVHGQFGHVLDGRRKKETVTCVMVNNSGDYQQVVSLRTKCKAVRVR